MSTPVPFRIRQDVMHRCEWACFYCGQQAYDDPESGQAVGLTIDHVIPRALDGSNAAENLVAACAACNNFKSDRLPHPLLVRLVDAQHKLWEFQGRPASKRPLPILGEDGIVYEAHSREVKMAAVHGVLAVAS